MTDAPPFPDLLDLIDERSAVFRGALAVADLEARVPGCPDWSLRDLAAHLGGVQRFWAAIVAAGPADGPPQAPIDREPHGDLVEWSAASTRLLLESLRAAGPDRACWAWWGDSEAPMTSGAVARHQVQEAAVHAFDAQETTGKPEPIPAGIAVDAIDEFLVVSLGSQGEWPHRPSRIAFSAVEGPTWVLDLTPEGARSDPAESGEPVATLHGSASDLILAIFKRIPLNNLEIDGDRAAAQELLSWTES